MKQECRNCKHWSKVSGTKKHKTEKGLCKYMNNRIYLIWSNKEPIRDEKNKSLVINLSSQLTGNIGALHISSTDSSLVQRCGWVWTDAGFYCAEFMPF
jgi:hypothetical protein